MFTYLLFWGKKKMLKSLLKESKAIYALLQKKIFGICPAIGSSKPQVVPVIRLMEKEAS